MENKFDSLIAIARKEMLTRHERASLRARILAETGITPPQSIPSPWAGMIVIRRHVGVVAAAFLLFFSAGGSLLAEQSLPGDLLYGVKTNVNEKVLGWFADSEERRAEWHLELADRRLAEIEKLSLSQGLSEEVRSGLAGQITLHMKSALGDTYEEDFDSVTLETTTNIPSPVSEEREEGGLAMMTAQFSAEPPSLEEDASQLALRSVSPASLKAGNEEKKEPLETLLPKLKRLLGDKKEELQAEKNYVRAKGLLIIAGSLHAEANALSNEGDAMQASRLRAKAEKITEELGLLLGLPPGRVSSSEESGEEGQGSLPESVSAGPETEVPHSEDLENRPLESSSDAEFRPRETSHSVPRLPL